MIDKIKTDIMASVMVNRYTFYSVFNYNSRSGFLFPLVNILINGVFFPAHSNIPIGSSFGGLNLYSLMGRDIAGMWDQQSSTLTVVGFY